MSNNMAPSRSRRVSEEAVRSRLDLIGHDHCDIVYFRYSEQLMHELIESLLPFGQCPSPEKLSPIMSYRAV